MHYFQQVIAFEGQKTLKMIRTELFFKENILYETKIYKDSS